MRDCVALMVVPNFVPAIHMTSEANWFGLGHHSEQKLDAGELLRLSQKLQSARHALACTKDDGQYRPGELARMSERIDQLDNLMPTQDFRVDLPDEGDFAGSEIFSSDAANLSPSLLTWFGEPPVIGKASDVFLLGKGFSVMESQVIAGGVKATFDLISRNVIRVTIPKDARTVEVKQGKRLRGSSSTSISPRRTASPISTCLSRRRKKSPRIRCSATPSRPRPSTSRSSIGPRPWPRCRTTGSRAVPRHSIGRRHREALLEGDRGLVPLAVHPSFTLPDFQKRATSPYRPPGPVPVRPGSRTGSSSDAQS